MKIKNITKPKTSVVLISYAIILVLSILLTVFLVKNNILKHDLNNKQNELLSTKSELDSTKEKLNIKIEECSVLTSGLETAEEVIESLKSEKHTSEYGVTNLEIEMLAKTVWGEARGCSKLQQSAVVWCVLNRVDAGRGTIAQVITAPGQFHGYHKSFPVEEEIEALVKDVVYRWMLEKAGCGNVGRTLPSDYLYFYANRSGTENVFRDKFDGNYNIWDWSYWNPYE